MQVRVALQAERRGSSLREPNGPLPDEYGPQSRHKTQQKAPSEDPKEFWRHIVLDDIAKP